MKQYIDENQERFFEELFSILRIPSISAREEHKADMYFCAEALADLLVEAGADVLVAGSAIFHAPNPLAEINALKAL